MGYIGHNGPLFTKRDGDSVILGTRILERHCNLLMVSHGGFLATFMDMVMPISGRVSKHVPDNYLLTITLTLDYLAGAPVGSWLEGRAEVIKTTKRMVFMTGMIHADGVPVTRGNGIFRIGPPAPPIDRDKAFEETGG